VKKAGGVIGKTGVPHEKGNGQALPAISSGRLRIVVKV
jgi:hypothetical protein